MKISPKEYATFEKEYTNGKWPHQRFGQAFLNKFTRFDNPHNEHMHLLWGTHDLTKAKMIIWAYCVECEIPEVHSKED